ncbi:hypothetical protein [Xenorhabdus bovienii]|uniref:Phage protein n=1 Tax=Xenorhabdus bovienii str. kraussei Becker Underwood TaxID=1398204 RepID=A0A077PY41_XENBV|nr:hypothetical protein [Xenorhabdus bovienii]MCG3461416.1 hypothetical protein [Xenorhabdus bovienii]CDH25586.1 conserved hypothetical protein [Xenorhabdus bovienii str. kraussei Becker Underwood]
MSNKNKKRNISMPYLIEDVDFNRKLRISEKNVDHTISFLGNGVRDFAFPDFVVPHGYRFVKSLKQDQYRMITKDAKPETVYAVKLIFRKDIVIDKETCTQIMVWRTFSPEHQDAVGGFPRRFFRFLLENYNIIVTDEEQTGDGKRFWQIMIAWAMSVGYYVYVSDGGEMDRPLMAVSNMDELLERWDTFCWGGDTDLHRHRLIVISKEALSQ